MNNIAKCPKCGNPYTCFRKDKIQVEGEDIDVIICNGCQSVISTYINYKKVNELIEDNTSNLVCRMDDIEGTISRITNDNCHGESEVVNEDDIIQCGLEREFDLQEQR